MNLAKIYYVDAPLEALFKICRLLFGFISVFFRVLKKSKYYHFQRITYIFVYFLQNLK